MRRKYITGKFSCVIMRGYDVMAKTQLIKTKCVDCGTMLGYFSSTGLPNPERLEEKCDNCLEKNLI